MSLFWSSRLSETCVGYRAWLLARGSLTQGIRRRCARFGVRDVQQRYERVGRVRALLREVYLYCGETPVVYAFSVLPLASLRGDWRRLGNLGARPLGEALFGNPRVQRAPLMFRKLSARHPLYRRASRTLSHPPASLWARRSTFTLHGRPIQVTEVFLPGILELSA